MKHLLIALIILTTCGCSTTRQPTITEDGWMVVGKRDKVEVQLFEHTQPYYQHEQLVYDVRLVNKGQQDVCANPVWMLDDLDNFTMPWVVIPARSMVHTGQLWQHVWKYDKTYLLIPPSGKVYNVEILKAEKINDNNYQCIKEPTK